MRDKYLDLTELGSQRIEDLVKVLEDAGEEISATTRTQLSKGSIFFRTGDAFPILAFRPYKDGGDHWATTNTPPVDSKAVRYYEFCAFFAAQKRINTMAENMRGCRKIEEAKKICEDAGLFVFHSAPEGRFPDLTGFKGCRGKGDSNQGPREAAVLAKIGGRFPYVTSLGIFEEFEVHKPLDLTKQEAIEIIAQAKEIEVEQIKIK